MSSNNDERTVDPDRYAQAWMDGVQRRLYEIERLAGAIADGSIVTVMIADGAVTPAKLDRAYVEEAGDTMTGTLNVQLTHATNPGVDVKASSDVTSERAAVRAGDWSWMQDTAADGTKDFALDQSGTKAIRVDTSRRISLGADAPTTVPVLLKRAGTTFTNPTNHDGAGMMVWNETNSAGAVAVVLIRVGGGSAGDPFLAFDVQGAQSWALGIDNSDGDSFKIAPNWTDVGSSPALVIDTSGRISLGSASPTTVPVYLTRSGTSYTDPSNHTGAGLYVLNSANSAGAVAVVAIRVAGGSAGDPFVSFDISGVTGYSIGIDNSDSDKFKIANAWNDLGTNTRFTIDSAGDLFRGTASKILDQSWVKYGSATVSLDASGYGNIAHGLGVNPTIALVVAAAEQSAGGDPVQQVGVRSKDATNIQIYATEEDNTSIASTTLDVYWLAIA